VKLQEDRGMIRRSPCRLRIYPAEIERTEIKLFDKHVDYTNRVVRVDPIIQAFGKQRRLPTIHPLDETLHRDLPRKSHHDFIMRGVFTQPGSGPAVGRRHDVGVPPFAEIQTETSPDTPV